MVSDRSDTSDGCAAVLPGEASGEDESAAMMSDDHVPISPSESNDTDDTTYFMPWLKVIIIFQNSDYFTVFQRPLTV